MITNKNKIEKIIQNCKEGNPNEVRNLVNSILSYKIKELLEVKRKQIQKEL